MSEPSMKQVWAGMAMMALLQDKNYQSFDDIVGDAWRLADLMEDTEAMREERRGVREDLR